MPVTASGLREDIYRLLDQVLESGVPLEIVRKGRRLRIVPDAPSAKLERLERREEFLLCDAEDLVHLDWSGEWQP